MKYFIHTKLSRTTGGLNRLVITSNNYDILCGIVECLEDFADNQNEED